MEAQNLNPFEDDKPQIVHLEKSESHYEYCRMQMHEIEKIHRRTFFCNLILCMLVCLLALFKKYIGGFDILNAPAANLDSPSAVLVFGIFQIVIAMLIVLVGYLAWANYHTLNIIMETWYAVVTIQGIIRRDYLTAVIGVVGLVFYFFSIRELAHEQTLSEMEGYPDFQEKFDISKSDIVVQTLLAHQGEHRTKSTLFTTDYSLRKKLKKKKQGIFADLPDDNEKQEGEAGKALAAELQKHLNEVREAKEAGKAASEAKKTAEAVAETAEKNAEPAADMDDLIPDTAAEEAAPAVDDAEAAAAAILAEAQEKAKEILAEAQAKAKAVVRAEDQPKPQQKQSGPQGGQNPNRNRNKKKRR